MTPLLISISVAHFFADFVFQTDWMAQNKSKNFLALRAHIAEYCVVLAICLALANFYLGFSLLSLLEFVLVNVGFHYLTDFITSKLTSYFYKKNQIHNFFVVVGADQLIHYSTFFLTFSILQS